ncbi:MAG: UDP-N-acetylmuramoyl-L-alanyl-D-glutamate--2,6-diaminopimelate ligase [Endomicrobiales bacterium]
MELSQLLAGREYTVHGPVNQEIKGIDYDSRRVKDGYLFVALPGHNVDGKSFVPAAAAAGAAAVVTGEYLATCPVTQIVVPDPLVAMARLSAEFYGHPDRRMLLVGITGTNGKTTITYLLESIFEKVKLSTGVVGTVNYRYGKKQYPAPNTTPQSADLYRFFHDMVKEHRKVAIMEVSSHALALGRVEGLEYDIGVFTNLTRDHLDFHGTMEDYFQAKSKLFSRLEPGEKKYPKSAIINLDDPAGKKLAGMVSKATVVTYGLSERAAVRAENIRSSARGTEFILMTPAGHKKVHLPHLGQHNVYNALASAGAALCAGISLEGIVEGLESAPMVPGRLEKVETGQNYTVVVDYAHTDDALKNVITALKELKPGRLITVFGCGGDRDRSKRPLMGEIATALSDFVFVTSDNPRSEEPQRIALDIEVGIRRQHRNNYQVILDREQAIAAAVSMAQKGDIILVAGKGHEAYQIIGSQRLHFNDTEVVRKYLVRQQPSGGGFSLTDMAVNGNNA